MLITVESELVGKKILTVSALRLSPVVTEHFSCLQNPILGLLSSLPLTASLKGRGHFYTETAVHRG